MSKETWIIEPRDALIARDGRPFGSTAGIRAKSLDFPFPSTTTGGARTRAGLKTLNGDLSKFDPELGERVLKIEVSGPLLAEIDGNEFKLLVHAPADCLIVKPENDSDENRFPLKPLERDESSLSNLPKDLHLLGTTEQVKGKTQSDPRFWHWPQFEDWLRKTSQADKIAVGALGHNGVTKEQRTHVRILDEIEGYKNKANSEGGLFQTRGMEFTNCEGNRLASVKRLAMVIEVDRQGFEGALESGIAPLGGERRIVSWRKSTTSFPTCPKDIREVISQNRSCRLILLTPAVFESGFKPTWLKDSNGLAVDVKAIAVNRAQVISGWDFKGRLVDGKRKQCPKPTRRMCPAGTVLFLKLSDADIGNWIDQTWFHCISDKLQDRKDGFGLAALGTWDGEFLKIEEVLK